MSGHRKPAPSGAPSLSPARAAASKALRLVQEQGASASSAIRSQIETGALSPEDERFASALTLGVVRTQGTLDAILDELLDKPHRLRPDVRRGLQIAAHELLFMDRAAPHAVDQGVRLIAKTAPFAKGFANAVLRRVAQRKEELFAGDARTDLSAFCLQAAFPEDLAAILVQDVGEVRARRIISAANERPPVFVHASSLEARPEETASQLASAGIGIRKVEDVPGCYRLERSQDVASAAVTELIGSGALIVSDLAAQLVAFACVRDGLPESLLEVGAGRGTKTILIQSMACVLYGRQVPRYVCVDEAPFKCEELAARARACGAEVEGVHVADGRRLEELHLPPFAEVLVDAPCSGIGTLRRHPEIRWRIQGADIQALAALQGALLKSAAALVEQKGRLVHSTCTVTRAEDDAVMEGFLATDAGASFSVLGGFVTVDDGWGADSHFCCILERTS